MEFRRDRARYLRLLLHRPGEERNAVAERRKRRGAARTGGSREGAGCRIEVVFGPTRARDRPIRLVPLDEFVDVPDLQARPGLPIPAVVLSLEEIGKESLLDVDAIVGVEVRPVLDAVRLEPFLPRGRSHEAFEIA